jgi:hypothetical protein
MTVRDVRYLVRFYYWSSTLKGVVRIKSKIFSMTTPPKKCFFWHADVQTHMIAQCDARLYFELKSLI